jgi:hypothetical protein
VFLDRVNRTLSSILVNRPEVIDAQEVQWPFRSLVEIVQILRQSPAHIHEAWHLERPDLPQGMTIICALLIGRAASAPNP